MKEHDLNRELITNIAEEIGDIMPHDELEKAHQMDALKWLKSGVNPFRIKKPDVPPKHLVSYFVLVDPDHHSILLVDHIKAQLWLPTGGHVKFNEHSKDAVIREAKEELSLTPNFLHNNDKPFFLTVTPTVGLTPGHIDVSMWYLLRGNVHDFLRYNKKTSEFYDTEWFNFKEILETDPIIFDAHLHRFVGKLAAYLSK